MNREHPACGACTKFKDGHCADFDRPAAADDQPCVLFLHRGTRGARMAARTPQELVAEIERKQQSKTR